MRTRAILTVAFMALLAAGLLAGTLIAGNEPLLGLDLQGGVSVVLEPTEPTDEDRLDEAIRIIRLRIDRLGVAEPEITRRGQTILVQVPGIDDPERALEVIGQTAELRFRPVLAREACGAPGAETPPPTAPPSTGTTAPGAAETPETTSPETTSPETTTPETTAQPPTSEAGLGLAPGESAAGPPGAITARQETPTTAAPTTPPASAGSATGPATTDASPGEGDTSTTTSPAPTLPPGLELPPSLCEQELTPPEADAAEDAVLLGELDDDGNELVRYQLGPTAVTGDALEGAHVQLSGTGEWEVVPEFKSGSPGIDDLNAIASQCFSGAPECPAVAASGDPTRQATGQLAIVLDSVVVSAPTIGEPSFERTAIQISGDFTQNEAEELALVLEFGALPVELEPQAAQNVSATVGEDALRAGVMAGVIGLGLAGLYMVVYYRMLGVVALASLAISGSLLWAIIAWLGETRGLALTLAGVTGIIVSFGVALDSNIVFYEHLKEDIRGGRTLRSSSDRSFASAFSTIVKADVASLIGALILYWLTIGSVRGFALYLGLATVLDLVASYLFMRPAVVILGRWERAERRPGLLGLPSSPGASARPTAEGSGGGGTT